MLHHRKIRNYGASNPCHIDGKKRNVKVKQKEEDKGKLSPSTAIATFVEGNGHEKSRQSVHIRNIVEKKLNVVIQRGKNVNVSKKQ